MFPKELTRLNRWVVAYDGEKIPFMTDGRCASPSDPFTWDNYKECKAYVDSNMADYLGYVFSDDGIVGIDIDKGFENGLITPLCADIMNACQSYTEISRSGRGVHIFVKGDLPFAGRNNRKGTEIYKSGRFFIMTGNVLLFNEIVENQAAIDYVVEKYFPDHVDERGYSRKLYTPTWKAPEDGRIQVRPNYTPLGPGERNDCLTSLAGAMWTTGYTKEQILSELMRANQQACEPPLSKREVEGIVRSISRYRR